MMKGMIFNIQRSSFDDGPGIRTVVFLKGCFLRCAWCHNPESQKFVREIMANKNKCTQCGNCLKVCPETAFTNHCEPNRDLCNACVKCAEQCKTGALTVIGKEAAADEIINEVIKDKKLYDFSNGGMTLSGGEPLAQPEFSHTLLNLAKEQNIHTCVETSGIGVDSDKTLEQLSAVVDLWLFDIKVTNKEKHEKYIGRNYEEVVCSLYKLLGLNAKVIIRSPIIPNVNDDKEHFENLDTLSKLKGVINIETLPYHSLGKDKYINLGRPAGTTFELKKN